MSTPVPSPIPAAPPVPDSSVAEPTFDAQFEAFLAWLKNDAQPGINSMATNAYANAVASEAAATLSDASRANAVIAANAAAAAAASAQNSPGTQATSNTSLTLSIGAKSLTLNETGKAFFPGQQLVLPRIGDPSVRLFARLDTFNAGTGVMGITVQAFEGTGGPYTDWRVGPGTAAPASSRGAGGVQVVGSVVLTSGSVAAQQVTPTLPGVSVTLPDATTMTTGLAFLVGNFGGYDVALRNNAGDTLGFVRPGTTATVSLAANATAAGVWVIGGASEIGVPASGEVSVALALGTSGTIRLQGVVPLDNTRELVLLAGDARLYAVVWDSATGTFGTPALVRAATFATGLCAVGIKSATDQVLVFSCDSTTAGQGVTLSVAGSAITVNTAASVTLASNWTIAIDLVQIVGQGFAVSYVRTSNVQALRAITVTGTTVSIGAESAITGTVNGGANPAAMFDTGGGKIVVFSLTSATSVFAQVFTMTGTALAAGTGTSVATNNTYYSVRALASGRWAIVYFNTGLYGSIVNLAGTVLTAATPVLLLPGATQYNVAWAKGSQVVVAGDASGNPMSANVLTDNAGVAVAGTVVTRDGGPYTAMVGSDADSVWVANLVSATQASGRVYRIGINGNNPAILNAIPLSTVGNDVGGWPVPVRDGPGSVFATFYGKNQTPVGLLQGVLVSVPADSTGYALSWKFSAGVPTLMPRQPGLLLANAATSQQWCRVGQGAQWAGIQSSTTSVILQKIRVA